MFDVRIRKLVREKSKRLQTYREPGKICGYLQPHSIAPVIACPVAPCPKIYYREVNLYKHLVLDHSKAPASAKQISKEAQNNAIANQIAGYSQQSQPALATLVDVVVDNIEEPPPPPPTEPPFHITEELQNKDMPETAVVFYDTEFTSGFLFPKGAIIALGVSHEVEEFKLKYTTINPAPYIKPMISFRDKPFEYSFRCFKVHKIKPGDVAHSPNLKDTFQQFFHYVTMGGRIKLVYLLAHNGNCDKVRILAIAKVLLPDKDLSHIVWVDTLPLFLPIVISVDPTGLPIQTSRRLVTLIAAHLPHLDISRAHSADFDVIALYQLILHQFNNDWDSAKKAIIQQAQKV